MDTNSAIKRKGLKDKVTRLVKNGYHNLSDFSSIHGFPELYQAKSTFWKIFWFLLLFASFCLTGRLIYAASLQFLNQGVTTVSETIKTEDMFYPPIKFCYQHWMYWIDFRKGFAMNFSKEAILYALSYVGNIYTSNAINVSRAKSDFLETFAENNFSTLTEFYKAIARYAPLARFEKANYNLTSVHTKGKYFSETELLTSMTTSNDVILFCYTQNDVSKLLRMKKQSLFYQTKENVLSFDFYDDEFAFKNHEISEQEHNSYVAEWIQTGNQQYGTLDFKDIERNRSSYHWYLNFANLQHNYTSFSIPTMIFPDGFSSNGIELSTDLNECRITVKIAVRVRKSTVQKSCDENVRSVVSNVTCSLSRCLPRLYSGPQEKSRFSYLHKLGKDKPDNLMRCYIYYLNRSIEEQPETYRRNPNDTHFIRFFSKTMCSEVCRSGCEQWNYEVLFQSNSLFRSVKDVTYKRLTTIQIIYPLDDEVVKVTEVDLQTWETFVGSVGGLLGIWTGASVLSFCQFFYVCICHK